MKVILVRGYDLIYRNQVNIARKEIVRIFNFLVNLSDAESILM